MNTNTITINEDECSLLCLAAARYALGRRTLVVGTTCQMVKRLAQHLSAEMLSVLIDDIASHARLSFGDDCDRADWMALRVHLIKLMEGKRGE